jgi:hypothetical protein
MNTQKALDFIESNNLIGFKAGQERETFLEIWMAVVDNRIFARSWGFAERSWCNYFLKDSSGEIKCGDEVFQIEAVVPESDDELNEKINEAYLKKYSNSEHNRKYAKGIVRQAHVKKNDGVHRFVNRAFAQSEGTLL